MVITEDLRSYYPRFSDAEYKRRYTLIREAMENRGLDCLIIYGDYRDYNQKNVVYVSNWVDYFQSYVVFPLEHEPTLFNSFFSDEICAQKMSAIKDTRWGGLNMAETVAERVRDLGLEKGKIGIVGVDSLRKVAVPVEQFNILREKLPQAAFEIATELLEEVRQIKSAEEIEVLRHACGLTDLAMEAEVKAIRPGVKEYEVHADLIHAAQRAGGTVALALFGSTPMADAAMPSPWPFPSSRTLQNGDVVLNELSIAYCGYSGQLGRPVALGRPTDEYLKLYDIALEVYHWIAAILRPGNTTRDVWEASGPITEAGLAIHTPLVHGWDNKVERPRIGLPTKDNWQKEIFTFKPGQVIMIEPNPCTTDMKKGVFFGNLFLITETGNECLQRYPLDFVVV